MVMNLLAFWSLTAGTSDAVVSQRRWRAHLHNDILACLHAGGDNYHEAAELGMRETPAEVMSVTVQPGMEGHVTSLCLRVRSPAWSGSGWQR